MAHIHTQPGHHDFTASAFIIRTDGQEPRVLLHMHRKLGAWLQFGGHVELHESPWAAIIHELREESGYELSQLRLLQPPHTIVDFDGDPAVPHPQPFVLATYPFDDGVTTNHFHTDVCYLFTTHREPEHAVSKGESDTLRLFTRAEIAKLSPTETLRNVQVAALHALDHILPNWQEVDPQNYSTTTKIS